jgi:hypothetical protein
MGLATTPSGRRTSSILSIATGDVASADSDSGGGRGDSGEVECGRPVVVWAGVGRRTAGVGPTEMDTIRTKVADARAERLNAAKLASIKPYSRHGF